MVKRSMGNGIGLRPPRGSTQLERGASRWASLALVGACVASATLGSATSAGAHTPKSPPQVPLPATVEGSREPASPPPVEPAVPEPARLSPRMPPELAEGAGIIASTGWAIVLGKALFWDQQVGSDGQACASCHFQAGADGRIRGQLNPGFSDGTVGPGGDTRFGSTRSDTGRFAAGQMPSGRRAGANYTLSAEDFPLHVLADEGDPDSAIVTDTNDTVSSAGAFDAPFERVGRRGRERCGDISGDIFHTRRGAATRQVEPRNTPTTINAVFNIRQFWDGRANNQFNGVGVFGPRDIEADPDLRLAVLDEDGALGLGHLELDDSSLASQAVGPPLSALEMSCSGRTFADLGRKMLAAHPLAQQHVARRDSVLGPYASRHRGLRGPYSYEWLIQQAFSPKYWAANGKYRIQSGALRPSKRGYRQVELNFSMFWGLAIMLYEAQLISDRSEFDTLLANGDITMPNCETSDAVDPLLARGCKIFFRAPFGPPPADGVRGVGCSFCHTGPDTFSEAAVLAGAPFPPLLQVPDVNGVIGTRDLGFANIGSRHAFVDRGLGGTDPYGNPLAFGRQYRRYAQTGDASLLVDPFLRRAIETGVLVRGQPVVLPDAKLESDGALKIPTIRNVALTPPYFSYGGYSTLRQVMKFYNRGGNRRTLTPDNAALEGLGSTCQTGDITGSGPDGDHPFPVDHVDCNTNTTGLIVPLGLSDCDENGEVSCDVESDDLSAVVRFMESLTDRRVQCDAAPFDHPELSFSHGHRGKDANGDGAADDRTVRLPAVGAAGYAPETGLCIPNAGDLFAPGMQGRVGGPRVPL